eukprot:c16409_g1_i2 orf=221-1087(-)
MGWCFNLNLSRIGNQWLQAYFKYSGMQSVIIEVDSGTFLHCWIPQEKPDQAKDKPAVMLIHGFAMNSMWHWSSQIRPLMAHFQLYVPDLIFWGKSTTNTAHRSEVYQAQMLMKLMQALGVSKFSVAGTSYGGFVAFWMAHHFPNAVDKVVIANSGVCMAPSDNANLLERANLGNVSDLLLPQTPAAVRTLTKLSIHNVPNMVPSFLLKDFIEFFYMESRTERVELLDNLVISNQDANQLPILKQKVLIIWGDHDGIFLPELAHALKAYVPQLSPRFCSTFLRCMKKID